MAFLYLLQAVDSAEPETREREAQRRRFWEATLFPGCVQAVCRIAQEEFQKKRFGGVVALLALYEADLPPVMSAKLAFARKKLEQGR